MAYVTDSPAGNTEVVRHDLLDGSTVLISRAPGHDGAAGSFGSFAPAISADGNRVAFESFAENFDRFGDDEGELHKIFVRDVAAGTTERVSRGSGPEGRAGSGASLDPAISGDGGHVAFWSTASGSFAPGERLGGDHVWVRDLAADRIALLDRASGTRGEPGNGAAQITSLSHSGRFAAFESAAGNLAPGARRGRANVFVRDLRTARTVMVSDGRGERSLGLRPAISGSGRYVAFERRSRDGVWHVVRARR